MPAVTISFNPFWNFQVNGVPAVGYQLFTYAAGTTTKQATYTDSTGATPLPNPILLNAYGDVATAAGASSGLWTPPGQAYKYVLSLPTDTDPPANPIKTIDNVYSPISNPAILTTVGYTTDTGTANAYVVGLGSPLSVGSLLRFTALNANTGASTLNAGGTGVIAIVSQLGVALTGGEILTTGPTWVQYTGSAWQIVGTGALPTNVRSPAEINNGVTPVNYNYAPGNAFRYGMVGDGTQGASTGTDNTAAFNNFVKACDASNYNGIRGIVPDGQYRFASKPAAIGTSVTIYGESRGGVAFLMDYNEATPTNGFIEANNGTLDIDNIYLLANNGHTGGAAVHLIGTTGAGSAPDYSRIILPYVSGNGGGTWAYGFLLDGSLRTSPPGVRDVIVDLTIFACTTSCVTAKTANNLRGTMAVFPAGGTASDITITGITGNTSNNINLDVAFGATLNFDWCNNVLVKCGGNVTITNTANASNVSVEATGTVSYQRTGPHSQLLTPGQILGDGYALGVLSQITDVGQTITANAQTITTNTGTLQRITSTTGANLTGMILQAGTVAGQRCTVMNANSFTLAFDVAGTSHVADGNTSAIPALTARDFTWNNNLSTWYRSA